MSHLLISNEVLLAKTESTYGTDSVPTAGTNAILIRNIDFSLDRLRMAQRPNIRGSLGQSQQSYAGSLRGFNFVAEVKGSGTAGIAPELGPLFQACGMTETIVGGTSVTYAPNSGLTVPISSVSIYAFLGGRVRQIGLGSRGNVTFTYRTGDMLLANFNFVGRAATVTDQTQPTPTFNATVPVAIKGLATTVGGVGSLVVQNYELALNNEMQVPDNLNDTEGYGNILITKRDPVLRLQRHTELVATINPYTALSANTAVALASGTLGSTAGNRIALTCAQAHYRGIEFSDDAGVRCETATFGCHEGAADTEFSLAFT